jgi:hypothetical protein
MYFFKRLIDYFFRYILGIFIAVITCGILSMIFKLLLITVQGPTIISQLSDAIVFYLTFSVVVFFLFRNYGKKQVSYNVKEFLVCIISIVTLHVIIIISTNSWSGLWFLSIGKWTFIKLLYTGVDEIVRLISYREIPRIYYYIAMFIQDFCFIIFSFLGYCIGVYKEKNKHNNNNEFD